MPVESALGAGWPDAMIVEVQDERLRGLKVNPERLRLEMAVGLYASEAMTLGQAAAVAESSQTQFLH